MTLEIPKVEDHLPDFINFVRRLSEAFKNGEFREWDDIDSRVNTFFTPEASNNMNKLIPGWKTMASYQNGRTQTHTVCVLIAMYSLPEFMFFSKTQNIL